MTTAIEITMTRLGFEVRVGPRTTVFNELSRACEFVEQRLQHAQNLREISRRCE